MNEFTLDVEPDDQPELLAVHHDLVVTRAASELGLRLEQEGFRLSVVDGALYVSPRQRLTPEDVRAIELHRGDLIALLTYGVAPAEDR
jgi:hypothetical protein